MSTKLSRKLIRAKKPKLYKDLDSSTLLLTMTEDFFQSARIYYDVYDQVSLQNSFENPHIYKVGLSPNLNEICNALIRNYKKLSEKQRKKLP
jgi:hypothetical protein